MILYEIEAGSFYHVIDDNNRTVAVVVPLPFEGVWIAVQPRTRKVLARDSRKNDLLPKLEALHEKGEI